MPFCRSVLEARQKDGMLASFPIYDDVTTFTRESAPAAFNAAKGVCLGFPCQARLASRLSFMRLRQGICRAGRMRGLGDPRSSLITELFRMLDEAPHLRLDLHVSGCFRLFVFKSL